MTDRHDELGRILGTLLQQETDSMQIDTPAASQRLERELTRSRGRRLAAVAAAAGVAAGVVLGFVLGHLTSSPTSAGPADQPRNTRTSVAADLVIEYWAHPLWGGHDGMVWVYGDGRVISEEAQHPYLERRLAPAGLDLLLNRVAQLRGGLTTDELRHPCAPNPCHAVKSVIQVGGLHYDVSDNNAMANLLFEMEPLFPDSAWRQRKPTPYMPSAYEACYGTQGQVESAQTVEQSSLLDGLPVKVRDLLDGLPVQVRDHFDADPTTPWPASSTVAIGPQDLLCSRLTPSQASRVAEALDLRLGFNINSNNQVHAFETVDERSAHIYVSVILPNGDSGAHGG